MIEPAAAVSFGELDAPTVLLGGVFGLLGLFLCYVGVTNLGRAYSIWSNDPIDAGSVHLERGVVEVQGEVDRVDGAGPLTAEYSGADCVAYTYKRKEKRRSRGSDDSNNTTWKTVESGGGRCSFYVTDASGDVAVDPTGATLSLDSSRVGATNAGTRK